MDHSGDLLVPVELASERRAERGESLIKFDLYDGPPYTDHVPCRWLLGRRPGLTLMAIEYCCHCGAMPPILRSRV